MTAGGFPAGFATGFDAGGAAGGGVMAELSSFKLLSTPENLRLANQFPDSVPLTLQRRGIVSKYTVPRDTGIAVSVKTNLALITRSATVPNFNNKYKLCSADAFYTTFAIVLARG
jgi:hypothetical protein